MRGFLTLSLALTLASLAPNPGLKLNPIFGLPEPISGVVQPHSGPTPNPSIVPFRPQVTIARETPKYPTRTLI